MDHFIYGASELCCEELPVSRLAEQFGTPLYLYSARTLTDHYHKLERAFAEVKPIICFSVKCCAPSGNLEYNDHTMGVRIKVQSVDGLFISPSTACTTPGGKALLPVTRATIAST